MPRHPEFDEVWKEAEEHGRRIRQGLLNFLVTSLIYALGLWYFSGVFQEVGIISWKLTWIQSTSVITAFNFLRVWDRAFMR